MKLCFDESTDTLYLRLDESTIVESEEVEPGVVLDFNAENQVVGIELLKITSRISRANLKQLEFKVA